MNMTDLFREGAEFMARDRPDIYTVESAMEDLIRYHDDLAQHDGPGWCSFTDFVLFKHVEEEEMIEWHLTRKLASATIFPQEEVARVYGHTKDSGTLTRQINLPDPLDDTEDF